MKIRRRGPKMKKIYELYSEIPSIIVALFSPGELI
jgi:hypothetical protein